MLCEHPPTISVGRSGSRAHIVPDDDALRGLGIKVHWVNRGGGCILHRPGSARGICRPAARSSRTEPAAIPRSTALDDPRRSRGVRSSGYYPARTAGRLLGTARVATVGVAVNRWIAYHG